MFLSLPLGVANNHGTMASPAEPLPECNQLGSWNLISLKPLAPWRGFQVPWAWFFGL